MLQRLSITVAMMTAGDGCRTHRRLVELGEGREIESISAQLTRLSGIERRRTHS